MSQFPQRRLRPEDDDATNDSTQDEEDEVLFQDEAEDAEVPEYETRSGGAALAAAADAAAMQPKVYVPTKPLIPLNLTRVIPGGIRHTGGTLSRSYALDRLSDYEQAMASRHGPPYEHPVSGFSMNARMARDLAKIWSYVFITPYREQVRAQRLRVTAFPSSTWIYLDRNIGEDAFAPPRASVNTPAGDVLDTYVFEQWKNAGLPTVDVRDSVRHPQPWQEVVQMLVRGDNAVDWGRSLILLSAIGGQLVWADELRSSTEQPVYDAGNLFPVESYLDSSKDVGAAFLRLEQLVQETPGRDADAIGTAVDVVQWDIINEDKMSQLERVYAKHPFAPSDREVEMDEAQSMQFAYNSVLERRVFMGIYGNIEKCRQVGIARLNKMLIACVAENAILYGPAMPLSAAYLGSRDEGESLEPYARACMKLWYGGTVWLQEAGDYDTLAGDRVDLLEFRRQSTTLLQRNWEAARLYAMGVMARCYMRGDQGVMQKRAEMDISAPARRLSPLAFAVYQAMLPFRWGQAIRAYSEHLRLRISADHYRPIMMTDGDEDSDDVYFWSRDRSGSAAGTEASIQRVARVMCGHMSLQAAATVFGTHADVVSAGGSTYRMPLRYGIVFRQLFGDIVFDTPIEYIEQVGDSSVRKHEPAPGQDLLEALQELVRLLELESMLRQPQGETFGDALYRLMLPRGQQTVDDADIFRLL